MNTITIHRINTNRFYVCGVLTDKRTTIELNYVTIFIVNRVPHLWTGVGITVKGKCVNGMPKKRREYIKSVVLDFIQKNYVSLMV